MNSILSGPCTVVQAALSKTIVALIVQETHTQLLLETPTNYFRHRV